MTGFLRKAVGVCLVSLVLGCASMRSSDPLPATSEASRATEESDFPTQALLPADALPEDLLLQQRVTIQWSGRQESFDAVLQKRGAQLLLLGLGPMNSVGFRLALDDRRVTFENRTGREMPFVPERILLDVQRVFYPWIDDAEQAEQCVSCDRQGTLGPVEILERVGARHLEERRFSAAGDIGRAGVVVRYEAWIDDPLVPSRVVLSNARHGYELLIETSSAERLD